MQKHPWRGVGALKGNLLTPKRHLVAVQEVKSPEKNFYPERKDSGSTKTGELTRIESRET